MIPNAISINEYSLGDSDLRARIRRNFGLTSDEFFWLAVGRLEKPKDYPNLLAAFRCLIASGRRAKLKIAGQGSLLHSLRELTKSYSLEESVEFLGLRRDIPELLHSADALVLSSAWEGMPNAVMEALATGVPVVATDVGGVRELVHDGLSGIITPPKDPIALCKAMSRMMELAPEVRRNMGMTGRQHIANKYDEKRIAQKWCQLIGESVGGRI